MVLSLYLLTIFSICQGYQLPPVKVQAIRPHGLRVSIPDDGFSRFIFRGALDKETVVTSTRWLGVVNHPRNGMWVYHHPTSDLMIGEVIYYTLYVTKDGNVYMQDGEYIVTEYSYEHLNFDLLPPRPTFNAPCEVSTTKVEGYPYICKGELIFSEDFSRISLRDLRYWIPENAFPEQPDYAFNVYQTEAIQMKSGCLVITPIALNDIEGDLDFRGRCSGGFNTRQCNQLSSGALIVPPIITGKITTKAKFSFVFGRIEISAKLPSGDWLIPELILEPRYSTYGLDNYASGLIRIAYTRGSPTTLRKLYGGPVLSDTEPFRSYFLREVVGAEEWNKNFHNYSLIWKPGFEISGREYEVLHAERWKNVASMAPLDDYFYISLGLRVGGVHDFPDSPDKPWKNRSTKAILDFWNNRTTWLPSWNDANLLVDYVRVYAL